MARVWSSGESPDGLRDPGVADGAARLAAFADAVGTFQTEEVVSAGHERRDDLALEAHGAVAAAFATGRGRGRG